MKMKVCMLWGPAVSQNLYKLLILLAVQASKRAYKYESQQKIKGHVFLSPMLEWEQSML